MILHLLAAALIASSLALLLPASRAAELDPAPAADDLVPPEAAFLSQVDKICAYDSESELRDCARPVAPAAVGGAGVVDRLCCARLQNAVFFYGWQF